MTLRHSFLAGTILALACAGAQAQGHDHDRDHGGPPPAHGAPGKPSPATGRTGPGWSGAHARGYVVVAAPPGADASATAPPPPPPAPDPIFYPRNGQGAEQTEADRRDCNSWATTQPNAMADAKVFQRATEACMDGRGYTMR
ncbi:MAG TPA: hypothetical protein VIN75_00430 [Burkholderiaceae bacterium]